MTTLRANPSDVYEVVSKKAVPGDTVELESGDYASLNLWNIKKSEPGVVVRPAKGAAGKLSGINANGSSWLEFQGFTIQTPGGNGIMAIGGNDLLFRDITVTSSVDRNGQGFFIRNSKRVTVTACFFEGLGAGGTVMDSQASTVRNSTFTEIATDGVILAGAKDCVVEGNGFRSFYPPKGAHPDAVQVFSTSLGQSESLVIEDNLIERGYGEPIQGIFVEDGADIAIRGNMLFGTMHNGIGIARTRGVSIVRNFLQSAPDMSTRIIVRQSADDVVIRDNASPLVVIGVPGEAQPTNVVEANTTKTSPAAPDDKAQYNAWAGSGTGVPPATSEPAPTSDDVSLLIKQVASLQERLTKAEAALEKVISQLTTAARVFDS